MTRVTGISRIAPELDNHTHTEVGLMGLLGNHRGYDRSRLLDAAARARARKQHRKAIELYRWVLAVEPQNASLHAKLGPLLVETGQRFDAWLSYRATARACLREGYADKALAVYREAAFHLPRDYRAWQAIAQLQQKRGRDHEAVETLVEGSRQLRSRALRPQAIYLLRRAREIETWDFETVLELARLLARARQRDEAQILLGGLTRRSQGDRLRRVRAAQLRLNPGPRQAWLWLRAALTPAPTRPARTSGGGVVFLPTRAARR